MIRASLRHKTGDLAPRRDADEYKEDDSADDLSAYQLRLHAELQDVVHGFVNLSFMNL